MKPYEFWHEYAQEVMVRECGESYQAAVIMAKELHAHDQQRAAELRERCESAANVIDQQQKAKHSDLTYTGDRYFRGALTADEMRDIIEAALAATAK